jgi:hypothetical protein
LTIDRQDPQINLVPHEQLQSGQADPAFKGPCHLFYFIPVLDLTPSKVYFTWVIRDFNTAEWFHSLLHALEEQDSQNRIEINIYLTGGVKEDDINNIVVRVTHF